MRVKRGIVSKRRHNKIYKLAKGFRGRRKNVFKTAKIAVEKSLEYAYRDRKARKREFRKLWIVRINAAARQQGMSYSKLMNGLKAANIELDRKQLADIAVTNPAAFQDIAQKAQAALAA